MEPKLSNVTRAYLAAYHDILENMIQGMTEAEMTDSISADFIVQMIPHHRAAIEMSRNILQYTTNIPLQEIAENIIEEQTKSIADMERILCCCRKETDPPQERELYQREMRRIMGQMFSAMRTACCSNEINCNFMWEMIPHHRGAVQMSKHTLQFRICPQLIPILTAIIRSQERGIAQMRKLQRCI